METTRSRRNGVLSFMEELKARIREDGRNLGGNILKVDGFINHRIDAGLMWRCGEVIASHFPRSTVDVVLTSEASGIAPSLAVAVALGVPVVYARKSKPVTMDTLSSLSETVYSRTKQTECTIYVSGLRRGERVLIVDDFLASGRTISALASISAKSGCDVVGVASLIEKEFEGAREFLAPLGVPILSLATVSSMAGQDIVVK